MAPNQPKTPVRTVRLTDQHVQSMTATGKTLTEAVRMAAEAFAAFTNATGTFTSDAHEAATLAAFPGLPEGMTLEEARRRAEAAVEAARPIIEREYADRLDTLLHKALESGHLQDGHPALIVPWGSLQSALRDAYADKG